MFSNGCKTPSPGCGDCHYTRLCGQIAWLVAETAAGRVARSVYAKLLKLAADGERSSASELTPEESHCLSRALDKAFCDSLLSLIGGE
jgi:hypothetical protein